MTPRSGSIYVEKRVLWALGRIAAAFNQTASEGGGTSVDALANDILMQYIKTTKPELLKLWDRREAISEEAVQLLNKPKPQ